MWWYGVLGLILDSLAGRGGGWGLELRLALGGAEEEG